MFKLKNIIGNRNLVKNIKESMNHKHIFHSYIIHGQKNSGKLFISKCFSKFILCENNKTKQDVCDDCYECHSFERNNNPDIIYVIPKKTNFIGVDDVREQIKEKVNIKPYAGKYKIFILEDADKMTVQAQNALLKILEEPPSFVIFFLLADDKKNLLPTIISRCIILKTSLLDLKEINEYLTCNYSGKEKNLVDVCCKYSNGNLGEAINLINNKDFYVLRNKIIDFLVGLRKINLAEAINFVRELELQKEYLDLILCIMYFWYEDLIFFYETHIDTHIKNKDRLNEIKEIVGFYDEKVLYKKLNAIETAKKYSGYNFNFKLNMTQLVIELFLN